jgi:ATP-dependent RNA helicase RhlE
VELARADVPRGSATFTAELERARAARADAGPQRHAPRRDHGGGGRGGGGHGGGGHGGGGHGRRRPASPAGGAHQASAGDRPESAGGPEPKPRLVGSWGPKRRR